MVTSVHDRLIELDFPAAASDGYALTSVTDPDYNRIAWANGESDTNWWPLPYEVSGVFWPEGVPVEETLDAFILAFQTTGWSVCGMDGSLKSGIEKLAIYTDKQGIVLHAARQLSDGTWTSKLGQYSDIQHSTPAALENSPQVGSKYGTVAIYMERARR